MKKLIYLFVMVMLVSGCATLHFPVVGKFQNNNELFIGQVVIPLNGTSYIETKCGVSGVTCKGNSYLTYVPKPFSYSGQKGVATLNCSDGRIISADFTTKTITSGWGSGLDQNGNKFTFTFGMSERKALKFIEEEQTKGQNKGSVVSKEHYKELMEQAKKDQAPIRQAVEGEANANTWRNVGVVVGSALAGAGQGMTQQSYSSAPYGYQNNYQPYSQSISMYDKNNNYYYGNINNQGAITMYDKNNNYYYGNVNNNGAITMHDQQGNYYYGQKNNNGGFTMYDKNGNYYYGK